jgi:hypothetical protein
VIATRPRPRSLRGESGAVSVSALLWLAAGAVLIYALFSAYYGDVDRFGRVAVPGQATVDLPSGESDISYVEQTAEGAEGADVEVPADLELSVVSVATGDAVELDPRGGRAEEGDGETIRPVAAVDPPAEGIYEVRVSSREAAGRAGPQLAFGESPFGAFGDRLSRVVDLLAGTFGIVLAALVLAAIVAPRLQRALGR